MAEDLLQCRLRIKEWERDFSAKNGRIPSKADIKAEPTIYEAYKAYNSSKDKKRKDKKTSRLKPATTKAAEPVAELILESVAEPVMEEPEFDFVSGLTDNEEETQKIVLNAELGPTPQANGKVLSIFDMIMSPPESSPIKKTRPLLSSPSGPLNIFKTPTKAAKKLQFTDLTPSRTGRNIMAQLQQVATPSRSEDLIVETPFYLGKVNNKFLFREEDSPEKPGVQSFPSTPTRSGSSVVNFQVSPSPLKSQRFLSFGNNKKVSDIFNDYKSIQIDETQRLEIEEEFQEEEEDVAEGPEEVGPQNSKKRRKITQKRTTRNWKIKPKFDDQTDTFDGKNVHDEIQKMEIQKDEVDVEEEASDDEVYSRPVPAKSTKKATPGKINPISNNFQRLKINDPRAKKFKQRMKRR